jgi:hypothetical protein
VEGQPNGEGEEIFANGDRYVGTIVMGIINGQGTYTFTAWTFRALVPPQVLV